MLDIYGNIPYKIPNAAIIISVTSTTNINIDNFYIENIKNATGIIIYEEYGFTDININNLYAINNEYGILYVSFEDLASSGYIYLGCYIDTSDRALPDYYSNGHSIDSCYQSCSHYLYFGLQNGGECWCGNDYASAIQYG